MYIKIVAVLQQKQSRRTERNKKNREKVKTNASNSSFFGAKYFINVI